MEQELKKVFDQKFLTATTFAMEIERIVQREEDMNYIDAIIHFCEENGIEVESVSKIISKPLHLVPVYLLIENVNVHNWSSGNSDANSNDQSCWCSDSCRD
jgi:hypothetical protein